MQPHVQDAIIFFLLVATTILTMSTIWKVLFAPFVGIIGLLTLHTLTDGRDSKLRLRFNPRLPSTGAILLILHLGVLLAWTLVTPASSLLFTDWGRINPLLYVRGVISLVYTLLVPGILTARWLDRDRRLTRLELGVLGTLFSFAIAAITAYILISLRVNMASYLFPTLWGIVTLGLIGNYGRRVNQTSGFSAPRPDSFPSDHVALMFFSIMALYLTAVLGVNVSWYALVRGDLWTHVAQTALYLQGQTQITYPWAYHFALSSVWAVSGLPLVNALVMMQFLAVLPMFAFYVTLNAYARDDSRIPILGTLFYACFMGLGWISYFLIQASTPTTGPVSTFGAENLASYLTYDILAGVLNIRLLFLPATLSLASVIYAMRLLRSYELPKSLIFATALMLTFLSLEAHLFESVFFVAVLALSPVLIAEREQLKILAICDLGVAGGFLTVYMIEYFSPIQQRLFIYDGGFYFTGYMYSVDVLFAALILLGLRLFLAFPLERNADPLEWIYRKIEPSLTKSENRTIIGLSVSCAAIAVALAVYLLMHRPTYFAWIDYATGYVPWEYYALRVGVVTLFAILGTAILLLRLATLRKFLELLLFGITALIVARGINSLGVRPLGFGENRVMDVLWFALAALAAFGLIKVFPRVIDTFGSSLQRKKLLGLALLVIIVFSGMTSFLILIDAKILDGEYSGYALTAGDLAVAEYLWHHPELTVYTVTSPTIQSQRKMMSLTLAYPYGYYGDFYVLPVFRVQTISSFFDSVHSLSSLRIFLGALDTNSLSSSGYLPALWYLAYLPLIVGSDGSFLLSSLSMNQPSSHGLIIVDEGQPASIGEFFSTSAFALTQNTYSILPLNQALQSLSGTLLLSNDPTNSSIFNATYSWVRSTSRTLVVVSGLNGPGLYETGLLHTQDLSTTFNTTDIKSLSGASFNIQLPLPLRVHSIRYQNATVIAEYSGDGTSTPLAAQISAGSGRIIFLNLRDYQTTLRMGMFTNVGRILFDFLPSIFLIQNVPLMADYVPGGQLPTSNSAKNGATSGAQASTT